jgi:hypothetical protein
VKDNIRRWMILLGVIQITLGCLLGLIPPSAVAWYRGLLMAHFEFLANGLLLIIFGLIVSELRLSPGALKTWFWALQIGTWSNGGAGLASAFLGASSKYMPGLNAQFPPPNGADCPLVSGLLILCAVAILIGLLLTIWGLLPGQKKGVE